MLIQANHKHNIIIVIIQVCILTVKLAHGLCHDATVVDYNLFIKSFNIGDVTYPANARLHKD